MVKLTQYDVRNDKIKEPLTIAHVSDLHEQEYEEVIQWLVSCKPDLILCTGDMLERHNKGTRKLSKRTIEKPHHILYRFLARDGLKEGGMLFFQRCRQIAPTYYSLGNHEKYLRYEDRLMLKQFDITLLDNTQEEIMINGNSLLIAGLSTKADFAWCRRFSHESGIKILMVHHPEYVTEHLLQDPEVADFDLICSGHAHGGQLRWNGKALFAPGQGLFPKYTHGLVMTSKGEWIISAGLSNTVKIPRFHNPKELVLIHLHR